MSEDWTSIAQYMAVKRNSTPHCSTGYSAHVSLQPDMLTSPRWVFSARGSTLNTWAPPSLATAKQPEGNGAHVKGNNSIRWKL